MSELPDPIFGKGGGRNLYIGPGGEVLAEEVFSIDETHPIYRSGRLTGDVITALSNPSTLDVAVNDFVTQMAAVDRAIGDDDESRFALIEARVTTGLGLIGAGHMDRAIALVAAIARASVMYDAMFAIEGSLVQRGSRASAGVFETKLVAMLDRDAPDMSVALLRLARDTIIHREPTSPEEAADMQLMLDEANRRIEARVGGDFDPLEDWATTEASEYPLADWQAIVAIVSDDTLWPPDHTLHRRLIAAQDTGRSIHDVMMAVGFEKGFEGAIASYMAKKVQMFAEVAAESYFAAIMAMAFYRTGGERQARLIAKNIRVPAANVYMAHELLRTDPPMAAEVLRIVLTFEDRRLFIDTLLDAPWPDRTLPAKLLDEICIIGTKRTAGRSGPFVSLHPIPMRIDCMLALAERREKEGKQAEGAELRRRAEQLQWQLGRGLVKHMPRKS